MYEETNGNNQSGTAANQQSLEPETVTLLDLANKPIWVAWRSKPPAGGVPHSLRRSALISPPTALLHPLLTPRTGVRWRRHVTGSDG